MLKSTLVFFFVLLSGVVFGQSLAPPQQPVEQHQTTTEQTTKAQADDNQKAKPWRESLSAIWEKTWDDPVTFYTFVLAIFTGLLAVVSSVQGIFLIRSDKTARVAANAADRSARAAVALQSAIITAEPDKPDNGDSRIGDTIRENCAVGSIMMFNRGATKAFPVEVFYGYAVGDRLPDVPAYQYSDRFPLDFFLAPEKGTRKTLTMDCELKPGQWSQICGGNMLFFYCNILYDDFMGERRSRSFAWKWSSVGIGLQWVPDRTHAYNRKT